jgi:tRNA(fMet)-specific endonuclease VapC
LRIRFLLDSNILSEPSRSQPNPQVLQQLDLHRSAVGVASVVVHEMLYGCWRLPPSLRRDSLWRYIQDSVLNLPVFNYDRGAARWHAAERARLNQMGRTPAFADGQIASIAASHGLVLVTNNVSDFQDFEGLAIENWFEAVG